MLHRVLIAYWNVEWFIEALGREHRKLEFGDFQSFYKKNFAQINEEYKWQIVKPVFLIYDELNKIGIGSAKYDIDI